MPLEEPPGSLAGFPAAVLDRSRVLARIHRAHTSPIFFSTSGNGRFDVSPEGTLYLAESDEGAFLEVFRGRVVALEEAAARRLAFIGLRRDVQLADLTSTSSRGFGITAEIHVTRDYARCQTWAMALHAAGFEGVLYSLRHDPSGSSLGVALFGLDSEVAGRLVIHEDRELEDDLIERVRRHVGVLVLPARRPG
ncbi:MAG: RES family NAD+ phosphorylase [Actinomycetota bacterium]